jgi:hypothetical protein
MTVVAVCGASIFLFLRKHLKYTNEVVLSCNSETKSFKSDDGKGDDADLLIKEEEKLQTKIEPSFKKDVKDTF